MRIRISYAYYESPSSIYNLTFFVKNELKFSENIDYIIVINGFKCSVELPKLPNLTVIKRKNTGYDFGAHNYALNLMNEHYDYYFFMNSSVIGPIIPHYLIRDEFHWSDIFINKINHRVKLVGTSIVCLPFTDDGGKGPKVEGFFFCTDNVGLKLILSKKTIFTNHKNKIDAVLNGEYGLTKCILKYGYNIDCMLHKYQGINWLDKKYWNSNNNIHPSRKNGFYGNSIDPYEVIFHKWYWSYNKSTVNYKSIQKYVEDMNKPVKYMNKHHKQAKFWIKIQSRIVFS